MAKKNLKFAITVTVLSIIIILVLFLTFFKKQPPPNNSLDLDVPFAATAQIKLGEMVAVADINKTAPDKFTFSIAQPENLKDISISYDGDKINVSYKGMGVDIDDDSIIAKSLVGIAVRAINNATKSSGVEVSEKDGVLSVKGDSEDGKFNILLNKEDKSLISLQVPDLDLECSFSNFIFTPKDQVEPSSVKLISPVD